MKGFFSTKTLANIVGTAVMVSCIFAYIYYINPPQQHGQFQTGVDGSLYLTAAEVGMHSGKSIHLNHAFESDNVHAATYLPQDVFETLLERGCLPGDLDGEIVIFRLDGKCSGYRQIHLQVVRIEISKSGQVRYFFEHRTARVLETENK